MKYLSVCSGIEAATVAWAKKLKARHGAGEKLKIFQIRSYKVALGITEKY